MARATIMSSKSSSSLSSKSKPKREAKMFSSCDACKQRKVKCDRKDKIISLRASHGACLDLEQFSELDSQVICSNCSLRGFDCIYSQVPIKTRKGKVLKTLQEQQEQQRSLRIENHVADRERSVASSGSGGFSRFSAEVSSLSLLSDEIFSLLGLTETILENCFFSFFTWIDPTSPLLPQDIFRSRYERYHAKKKDGIEIPNPNDVNELFDSYDEPASEFWILAILICGAGALTSELDGFSRRFQIQEDLSRMFRDRLFANGGIERLVSDDLDALEALFFLWEAGCSLPAQDDIDARSLATRNHSSDWVISITSLDGLARFAEKLGLNFRPDRKQMRGKLLSSRDMERRARPFLYLYSYDVVMSFCDRTPPRWTNDHHSFGIPEFLLRPGAPDDEMELDNLAEPTSSPLFQIHFGAAWSLATFKWTLLVRKWHRQFLTPRVQQSGVDISKLTDCLEVMETFRSWMPRLVNWDLAIGTMDGNLISIAGASPGPVIPGSEAHQNLSKTLQLEFQQTLLLVNLVENVETVGFERNGQVDSWEIALAKFKLEQAMTSAFWRSVEIVRVALDLRLLRGNVRIIRTCLSQLVSWGSRKIDRLIEEFQDSSILQQFASSLPTLIQGCKMAGDCDRDNINIISSLEGILHYSRTKVDLYIERAKSSPIQNYDFSGLNISFDQLLDGSNATGGISNVNGGAQANENTEQPRVTQEELNFQNQMSRPPPTPDWPLWKDPSSAEGDFDDLVQFS